MRSVQRRRGFVRVLAHGLAAVAAAVIGLQAAPSRAGSLSDAVRKWTDSRSQLERVDAGPPLDVEEAAQIWDAFLTAVIKHAGTAVAPEELRDELLSLLLDDRYEVVAALAATTGPAGGRWLTDHFQDAWPRLEPVLARVATQLPSDEARGYRDFLASGRLLERARRAGLVQGDALSPAALRNLAQRLLPAGAGDPLRYEAGVDPELRAIFGFAELPAPVASPLLEPTSPTAFVPGPFAILAWLAERAVPTAHAASSGWDWHTLVTRLNSWVPSGKREMREYLPMIQQMLDGTAHTLAERRLPASHFDVYRDLVVATAWQESCWRQYEKRAGQVQPLRGPGGIGLMQINTRVWRGIYDSKGVAADIGYNGRAGAEILYHYMRKHAIRGKEHLTPGGERNLARATYAAYNGGPGHLRRYRKAETSARLRAVDAEFWQKYQAVENGDESAFFSCSVR
jgi:soluble lytic murein transglycosylase-like protein